MCLRTQIGIAKTPGMRPPLPRTLPASIEEKPVHADPAVSMAKHERKPEGIEQEATETRVNDTFHEDVDRLTRPTKARLQHREADLHAENQERCHQRPDRIDRIDYIVTLENRIGSERTHSEQTWIGDSER